MKLAAAAAWEGQLVRLKLLLVIKELRERELEQFSSQVAQLEKIKIENPWQNPFYYEELIQVFSSPHFLSATGHNHNCPATPMYI